MNRIRKKISEGSYHQISLAAFGSAFTSGLSAFEWLKAGCGANSEVKVVGLHAHLQSEVLSPFKTCMHLGSNPIVMLGIRACAAFLAEPLQSSDC